MNLLLFSWQVLNSYKELWLLRDSRRTNELVATPLSFTIKRACYGAAPTVGRESPPASLSRS